MAARLPEGVVGFGTARISSYFSKEMWSLLGHHWNMLKTFGRMTTGIFGEAYTVGPQFESSH